MAGSGRMQLGAESVTGPGQARAGPFGEQRLNLCLILLEISAFKGETGNL